MRIGVVFILLFLSLGIEYLLPGKVDAIPYFARKYNTQCTMCHTQFPILNPTGITFKQNGYRLRGEEGDYIWQDKFFPISGKSTFKYKTLHRKGDGWGGEDGSQSIFSLAEMKFFSVGTLAPRVSYYLDFGSEDENDIAPGIAFIIFDDILPENKANIKVGKFYNEFLYLVNRQRLTLEPYIAPVTRIQYGVEFNGEMQSQGISYAFGIANDEMTREKPGQTGPNYKDVNNDVRTFYGWAAYSIAGQTLGIRGYTSKALEGFGMENNHTQFDANLKLQFDPVIFILAYYTQTNVEGIKDNDQNNLLTEWILKAGPKLIFDLRYEIRDRDITEDKDVKYVLSAGYYVAPNIRFMSEYVKQDGEESQKDEDKLELGVQLVF